MNFFRDRQIKAFCIFLFIYTLLLFGAGFFIGICQAGAAKELYLFQAKAAASSLLEQGVSKSVAANALTSRTINDAGSELVAYLGLEGQREISVSGGSFQGAASSPALYCVVVLSLVLWMGTAFFFWKRQKIYMQAENVLSSYINGDYSSHLPQNKESSIFQIFASIEQLATMLQAKNEAEHKAKEFLKSTISDMSHQLKTPLTALKMYQEIIENEPDNIETVKEFSRKTGIALNRMEQLTGAMLKIARLDAGSIVFEKRPYFIAELVANAVSELTIRAEREKKQIIIDGNTEDSLVCDMEWTGEAIGNIVKNALDHTEEGGVIHIRWEDTPAMQRISISDNGKGIEEEDIYHIFKRFYRSKNSLDRPGAGLGLPLAKSIVEGQGGVLSVKSVPAQGTVFTLSFLTEL